MDVNAWNTPNATEEVVPSIRMKFQLYFPGRHLSTLSNLCTMRALQSDGRRVLTTMTTMLIQRMSSSGAIGKVQLLICGMSFMFQKNHTNIGILSELYNANGTVGAGPGWCWLQRLPWWCRWYFFLYSFELFCTRMQRLWVMAWSVCPSGYEASKKITLQRQINSWRPRFWLFLLFPLPKISCSKTLECCELFQDIRFVMNLLS